MKVLAFCSYPDECAGTRYRLSQFVRPLAERGIDVTVAPFLNDKKYHRFYKPEHLMRNIIGLIRPFLRRFGEAISARSYDVIFVQREAMMFGPPIFEWIARKFVGRPIVLDLDDATYVPYMSPSYGRLGSALKFFGKTDQLIAWSETTICCNRFVADYVEKKGKSAVIVPTVVDTDLYGNVEKKQTGILTIGWIGSHSTLPLLASLFPVLQKLAAEYDFTLKIVGAGQKDIVVPGVEVQNIEWSLEREVREVRSFDIGLYPMVLSNSANREWLFGKSCFKAVQYMSAGIPFVLTPMGNCAETGIGGETHYFAETDEQWYSALKKLLDSPETRKIMGERGRQFALEHFTIGQQVDKLERVFHASIESFRNRGNRQESKEGT